MVTPPSVRPDARRRKPEPPGKILLAALVPLLVIVAVLALLT